MAIDVLDQELPGHSRSRTRLVTRVLGIVLAALAVQFVLNDIAGYYDTLKNR
jgi:hypothetical protein